MFAMASVLVNTHVPRLVISLQAFSNTLKLTLLNTCVILSYKLFKIECKNIF